LTDVCGAVEFHLNAGIKVDGEGGGLAVGIIELGIVIGGPDVLHFDTKLPSDPEDKIGDLAD
jgi:hypothetical protein